MSCRCYEITLPDGSKAIVRTARPGWTPTQAELALIVKAREELLSICPGCGCYRHRCACDLREESEGMGGDAILDRMVP